VDKVSSQFCYCNRHETAVTNTITGAQRPRKIKDTWLKSSEQQLKEHFKMMPILLQTKKHVGCRPVQGFQEQHLSKNLWIRDIAPVSKDTHDWLSK